MVALRKLRIAKKCATAKAKKKPSSTGTDAGPPTGSYGPRELQKAYNLPGAAPMVQTIAFVVAYHNPNAEQDLGVYSRDYGLPACSKANGCFLQVNGQGKSDPMPEANALWALESSTDIQAAHAICHNCRIILVEIVSDGVPNLVNGVDTAIGLGADVVALPWTVDEFSSERHFDRSLNRPGVPIVAASGDIGGRVQWPAASPYVTAVGGTSLTLDESGTRVEEKVWDSSGSGCSAYEDKPAWQTDLGCAKRSVPDVSAVGDPSTGIASYDSYGYAGHKGWFVIGGTSLGTPIIAAIYALAGNASEVVAGSYPYAHTDSLFDITTGSNGSCPLCTAGVGYDGPSGLGSPNGVGGF